MSRGECEIGSDGLTTNERAVLDLYDAGQTDPVAIVRRLQLTPAFVTYVLKRFVVSDAAQPRAEAKVRAATQALAVACVATGRCFQ